MTRLPGYWLLPVLFLLGSCLSLYRPTLMVEGRQIEHKTLDITAGREGRSG